MIPINYTIANLHLCLPHSKLGNRKVLIIGEGGDQADCCPDRYKDLVVIVMLMIMVVLLLTIMMVVLLLTMMMVVLLLTMMMVVLLLTMMMVMVTVFGSVMVWCSGKGC